MNELLSIYCYPKYETTKNVLFCLLKCQYKNRCHHFIKHYMTNQTVIDAAVSDYNGEKDREKREVMMNSVIEQKPVKPAADIDATSASKNDNSAPKRKTIKRETSAAVTKAEQSTPQIRTRSSQPKKSVSKKATDANVKLRNGNSAKRRSAGYDIGNHRNLYILVEENGKGVLFFTNEAALVAHISKSRTKARYFKAQELEPELRLTLKR